MSSFRFSEMKQNTQQIFRVETDLHNLQKYGTEHTTEYVTVTEHTTFNTNVLPLCHEQKAENI